MQPTNMFLSPLSLSLSVLIYYSDQTSVCYCFKCSATYHSHRYSNYFSFLLSSIWASDSHFRFFVWYFSCFNPLEGRVLTFTSLAERSSKYCWLYKRLVEKTNAILAWDKCRSYMFSRTQERLLLLTFDQKNFTKMLTQDSKQLIHIESVLLIRKFLLVFLFFLFLFFKLRNVSFGKQFLARLNCGAGCTKTTYSSRNDSGWWKNLCKWQVVGICP